MGIGNKIKAIFYYSFILGLVFASCSKSHELNEKSTIVNKTQRLYDPNLQGVSNIEDSLFTSSISYENGIYKVDSASVLQNKNRKRLLAAMAPEYLVEKKTAEEIPAFITSFFNGLSENGSFDMVNPGEEWKSGIADFGHMIMKKVYSPEKKDSIMLMSFDKNPLPAKQLVYFGIGKNMALFSYYSGGIRTQQHIAMIQFEGKQITDFWFGNSYSDNIHDKAELIKQIKLNGTKRNGC